MLLACLAADVDALVDGVGLCWDMFSLGLGAVSVLFAPDSSTTWPSLVCDKESSDMHCAENALWHTVSGTHCSSLVIYCQCYHTGDMHVTHRVEVLSALWH